MNEKDINAYNEVKNKILTTSEVIQKSFVNVLEALKKEDFVIVENQRQKKTMIIQEIDTFINYKNGSIIKKLTKNQLLAKTYIKENTFFLMKFESKNITFPEIESILQDTETTIAGFDAEITRQLMEGWKFVINNPKPLDFNMMLKINGIIAKNQALEWGVLRTGKTGVSGTTYSPAIPTQKIFKNLLNSFHNQENTFEAASNLLINLIKLQPFWDGNKRTAFLTVNKLLIEKSKGLLVLNHNSFDEFNTLLHNYYEYNDPQTIINFIMKNMFITL